jgi:hypothetical protein
MTMSEVLWMALQAAAPVLVAAATVAAAKLASYIGSKVQNEYLRGALTRLDDAVLVAVKELQQTVVAELKAAAENGKLDETARKRVKDAALANVKSYIGPKGLSAIADVLGLSNEMLEQFVRSRIEAAVHDVRLEERVATASVVVTNTVTPPAATARLAATPATASSPTAAPESNATPPAVAREAASPTAATAAGTAGPPISSTAS